MPSSDVVNPLVSVVVILSAGVLVTSITSFKCNSNVILILIFSVKYSDTRLLLDQKIGVKTSQI